VRQHRTFSGSVIGCTRRNPIGPSPNRLIASPTSAAVLHPRQGRVSCTQATLPGF
jgi:hypothetical protein